jgi:hypothetical protein
LKFLWLTIPLITWVISASSSEVPSIWFSVTVTKWLITKTPTSYIAVMIELSIPFGSTFEERSDMHGITENIHQTIKRYVINGELKKDGDEAFDAMKKLGGFLKKSQSNIEVDIGKAGDSIKGKGYTKQFITYYTDIKPRVGQRYLHSACSPSG